MGERRAGGLNREGGRERHRDHEEHVPVGVPEVCRAARMRARTPRAARRDVNIRIPFDPNATHARTHARTHAHAHTRARIRVPDPTRRPPSPQAPLPAGRLPRCDPPAARCISRRLRADKGVAARGEMGPEKNRTREDSDQSATAARVRSSGGKPGPLAQGGLDTLASGGGRSALQRGIDTIGGTRKGQCCAPPVFSETQEMGTPRRKAAGRHFTLTSGQREVVNLKLSTRNGQLEMVTAKWST